jgi:hypothetical protein
MSRPLVIIGDFDDRRTFDLYNRFKHEANWQSVVYYPGNETLARCLYPLAKRIKASRFEHKWNWIGQAKTPVVWLPMTEEEVLEVFKRKNEWPSNFHAFLPQEEMWSTAADKERLNRYFAHTGWVPNTFKFDELRAIEGQFQSPVVAKPKWGKGAIGKRLVQSSKELEGLDENEYTLQQFVGDGVTVFGFFSFSVQGNVISSYQHKRLKTYPSDGGVSIHAKIVYDEKLQNTAEAMIKQLKWTGLSMLEFLKDEQANQWYCIECNPRLWGTCLLGEQLYNAPVRSYIETALGIGNSISNDQPQIHEEWQIRWWFPYQFLAAFRRPFQEFCPLFPQKQTVYIGLTGAGLRSVVFIFASVMSPKKWKKLLQKMKIVR